MVEAAMMPSILSISTLAAEAAVGGPPLRVRNIPEAEKQPFVATGEMVRRMVMAMAARRC